VNWVNGLDSFEFNNHSVFNDEVEPQRRFDRDSLDQFDGLRVQHREIGAP